MQPSPPNGGGGGHDGQLHTSAKLASMQEELWQSIAKNLGLADSAARGEALGANSDKKTAENFGAVDPQQYKNLATKMGTSHQSMADSLLAVVDFNMEPEDMQQVWFHKKASRKTAEDLLAGKPNGTFLLRPSSQRGSYALSYIDDKGAVQHDLIYVLCPGFSLQAKPEPEQKFWSLATLVAQCDFLKTALPSTDSDSSPILSHNLTRSGVEVVSRVLEQLLLNSPTLVELNWQLAVLEGHLMSDIQQQQQQPVLAGRPGSARQLERRTFVRYASEEYVAPDLLPLRDSIAKILLDAFKHNTSVRVLNVNGHKGFMRLNFTPNFTDLEAQHLAGVLRVNSTLTRVDLSVNRIGDEGAIYLAQALRVNRSLKTLNLSHNFIRADGLFAVAEALKLNTTLEEIDVSSQMMQRAGTTALAANDYERTLVTLIEGSLKRRRELLDPQILPSLWGYRTRAEAESLLSSAEPGACMLYLNPRIANTVCRAIKRLNGSIEHTLIYPVSGAYSVGRRDPTLSPLPSLVTYCAWFLANPQLQVNKETLPHDVLERIAACTIHNSLWGIREIPSRDRCSIPLSLQTVPLLSLVIPRNARQMIRTAPASEGTT